MENKNSSELREKAEKKLKPDAIPLGNLSKTEIRKLAQELQIHQIELEMQAEELHKTQVQLEQSRQKYFNLYDLAPLGYFTLTEKGFILEANLEGASMLGTDRRSLIKKPLSKYMIKEDSDLFYLHLAKVAETENKETCELRMLKGDSPFYVQLESIAVYDAEGNVNQYLTTITDISERMVAQRKLKDINETLEFRVKERTKDLATQANVLKREIEERRKAEEARKQLQEQLYHSQKLESIGRLGGGVAHDFNNILTAIIGYSNVAIMGLKEGDPARTYLQKILEVSNRASNLVQSLLAFSRRQPVSLTTSDVNTIIKNIKTLLAKIARETVVCRFHLTPDNYTIMADSDKLEQVIINLAANAVDAMPEGGSLTISTETAELDDKCVKKYGLDKAGKYGVITVSDTGSGMDDTTKEKIFEPFFTTKESGKGTGIGLSIAYGIIQQHNGCIDVSSEPGKGSAFKIYLPLVETKKEAKETAAGNCTIPTSGTETILLAEDEKDVREIITMLLEYKGYTVISAVDGEDAVNKFQQNKDVIDMLVFDVMMPQKNGKAAYDAIKIIKPDTKVLFMSGYSEDGIINKEIREERLFFMQKPVVPDKLLKNIREILHN
ncbi:MAG: response regulator [Candidatus Kuenenia sp.]|nr:response regulator [Candidatus Kuenenia hertensis]